MSNGLDTLITKIWVTAITDVANDGNLLAKEMIEDPSKLKDMVDISNGFNDLFQKMDGAQVAESIFRDFFGILGGFAAGGIATVGSLPFAGPWAPVVGAGVGEAFTQSWDKAFDEAKNWSSNQDWGGKIYDWLHPENTERIDPQCRADYNAAQTWHPHYDPLTLDLDGDGIEVASLSSSNPILFDNNADGINEQHFQHNFYKSRKPDPSAGITSINAQASYQ